MARETPPCVVRRPPLLETDGLSLEKLHLMPVGWEEQRKISGLAGAAAACERR